MYFISDKQLTGQPFFTVSGHIYCEDDFLVSIDLMVALNIWNSSSSHYFVSLCFCSSLEFTHLKKHVTVAEVQSQIWQAFTCLPAWVHLFVNLHEVLSNRTEATHSGSAGPGETIPPDLFSLCGLQTGAAGSGLRCGLRLQGLLCHRLSQVTLRQQ